jgi:hypothetical protein
MKGWPKWDADIILYAEVVLMGLFLTMNASDYWLQLNAQDSHYHIAGSFPVSQWILPLFDGMSVAQVVGIERTTWWLHITGDFTFLKLSVLLKALTYYFGIPQYLVC